MNAYLITEPEAVTLGLLNSAAAISISLAATLLGWGIGIRIDAAFAGAIPISAQPFVQVIEPICFTGAALFFAIAFAAAFCRGTIWRHIKRSTNNTAAV